MAATDKMFQFAKQLQPDYCCIVPEKRQELTTEGGLDVVNNVDNLKYICSGLQNKGIKVSLFIDADAAQLDAAIATETDMIEIHTGHFASATDKQARQKELNKISQIAESGVKRGLQVNAGHGLNYDNVTPIAANSCITELNIGHAIVAEAIFTGLTQAVERMKKLMEAARS